MPGVKTDKDVNIRGFCNSETQIAALGVDLINQYTVDHNTDDRYPAENPVFHIRNTQYRGTTAASFSTTRTANDLRTSTHIELLLT